jgi:hypothetical protein
MPLIEYLSDKGGWYCEFTIKVDKIEHDEYDGDDLVILHSDLHVHLEDVPSQIRSCLSYLKCEAKRVVFRVSPNAKKLVPGMIRIACDSHGGMFAYQKYSKK